MKKLLSVVAIASLVLLSFNAHSKLATNKLAVNKLAVNKLAVNKLAVNGVSLNGVSTNGADQILNLRGLAQAALVKAN